MRWYCVHPSLPLQAELRIRIAPDFNASESIRIPQGRAVAACSPVFLVPNEDVDAEPTSWLQVAYQDPVSGETDGGFVMAALPDGTALVVPWEETNYYGCCEITNSTALLLDGPHDGARSVGSVQNTKLLYCTLEEGEKRFRIFHPELENVWIDKTDVRIVCTRLKHQQCRIPHTFIELNEALPDEAQIAIREFPSQKAQTIGLLSRGKTLEVVVRCGNWLQIAGTDVDKTWIMWRTDALELLQEASDVRSNACIDIRIHLSAELEAMSVVAAGDERPIRPARSEVEEEAHTSVQVVDDVSTNEFEEECERVDSSAGMEAVSVVAAGDERPIRPARSEVEEEAHTSVQVVDDVSTNEFEEECERVDSSAGMEAVSVVAAGDERPIRPARSEVEEEAHTSVQVVDDVSTNEFEEECERVDSSAGMEAVSVVAAGDERPIRPARSEVEEEAHTSVQVVDDVSTNEFEEECERVDSSAGMEAVSVVAAGDERPIRPARSEVEEEAHTSVQVVDDVSTNEFEEECERVDSSAGMEAVSVVAAGDERPIRPARSEVEEEAHTSVQVVDDVSTNEFEEECERVDSSAGMEAVSVVAAGDERPIRPARSEVEEVVDVLIKVLASTGADFEGRDVMENFTAKYAAASAMYGSVGCTGETTGSAPESDAGDIVVLGNLDDVFEAVDEIFVGIAGEENTEIAVCEYNDTLSQEKEQSEFVSGACDVTSSSFTFVTQLEPNVKVPDNTTSALASFLQEFGVIEYCERKKALYPANDRLSQAMFNADQDDTDLLFEVFVGDDPLSDEWFHDVAPKGSVHFASLAATNPSLKTTYALIMGGATAEAILESELDDDDGDYDLVNSFRYPLPIRSRPSPLKPTLRQRQSASADSFPEALQATIDQAVPPASRLEQRKFIKEARSIAKPQSTLIRPRSFTHTPAFTSKAPIESTIGQAAPVLSATSPSKPPETLVQRKSAILTPKLQKISTSASSIPEPAAPSGLSMPRTSFGFRRPSSSRRK